MLKFGTRDVSKIMYRGAEVSSAIIRSQEQLWKPLSGAALDMDFSRNKIFGDSFSNLANANNSGGYAQNLDGSWTLFPANTPRRTNRGLLTEEGKTNYVRNNLFAGMVPGFLGSGGSFGTYWSIDRHASQSVEVIGTGVEDGIQYIEFEFSATDNQRVYLAMFFDQQGLPSPIPVVQNETLACSAFLSCVSSDISMGNWPMLTRFTDNTGASLNTVNTVPTFSPPAKLKDGRMAGIVTASNAATTQCSCFIQPSYFGIGQAFRMRMRLGFAQVEKGVFVSSPIRTAGAVSARNSDVLTIPVGAWYNQAAVTLLVEGTSYDDTVGSAQGIASLDNATAAERIQIRRSATSGVTGISVDDNVTQANHAISGSWPANTRVKTAFGVDASGSRLTATTGTPASGAGPWTMPTITRLGLGFTVAPNAYNGYIHRVTSYQSKLANAAMDALVVL